MIKGSSVRETFKVTGRLGDRVRDIREWREELRSEVKIWFSLLEKFFFTIIPIAHWHCKLHIGPLQKLFLQLERCQEETEHLEEARRHLEYAHSQSKRPLQVSKLSMPCWLHLEIMFRWTMPSFWVFFLWRWMLSAWMQEKTGLALIRWSPYHYIVTYLIFVTNATNIFV